MNGIVVREIVAIYSVEQEHLSISHASGLVASFSLASRNQEANIAARLLDKQGGGRGVTFIGGDMRL